MGRRHLRPLPPSRLHHQAEYPQHSGLERERLQGAPHQDDGRDRLPQDGQDPIQVVQAASRALLRNLSILVSHTWAGVFLLDFKKTN